MQGKYLLDASALFLLVQRGDIISQGRIIKNIHILHLTIYEIGNVLWKEAYIFKRIKDLDRAAELIQEILRQINILADPPIAEVLRLSVSRGGLTFYDASYVYAAESMGFVLVTEDRQMLKSTSNAISFGGEFVDAIIRGNA
ncbi:type II toxin-antitoxin system VapC family toxin [Vulcanisaeta distributa]|uniref:type II toxin-antitoxin system VapC family toxin n=1 Tax=Vulcanisaeta distributa TaxID=164451 RepID=UPI0006D1F004|nr:type II toxin-antitoxin system VapC family toxin [Vulcanisaeta distributa]